MNHLNLESYERYVSGEMKGEELENYTRALQESKELREEFLAFREGVKNVYASNSLLSVSSKQEEANEFKRISSSRKKSTSKSIGKYLLPLAAVFLLLFGWFYFLKSPSGENLILAYEPEMISPPGKHGTKSSNSSELSESFFILKDKMLIAHESKKWKEVIDLLSPFLASNQSQLDEATILNLYLGNAYLNINEFSQAAFYLEKVESEVSDTQFYKGYKALASYQLALSYLGRGNKEKAIILLKELSQSKTISVIQNPAKDLLIKINNDQ